MAILPVCTWPSFLSKGGHPSCQHVSILPVYMWSSLLSTRGHLSCLRVAILPVYTWPSFLSSHGHPSNLQEAILPVDRWPLAIHPFYSGHLKTVSSGHHTCQQMAIIPCLLLPTLPILTRTLLNTSISFREVQVTICLNLIFLCLKCVVNRKPVMGTECE